MKIKNFFYKFILSFFLIFAFTGCVKHENINSNEEVECTSLLEDKAYYKKDDVVDYIKAYKKLPPNFLTKKEAKKLGWIPKRGNLWEVTDKGVIGGDYFGNFEKNLPDANYKECDVNYFGGRRGGERLIYDEDFNIFYTKDHYKNFTKEN